VPYQRCVERFAGIIGERCFARLPYRLDARPALREML
jgi:hypothetical protein